MKNKLVRQSFIKDNNKITTLTTTSITTIPIMIKQDSKLHCDYPSMDYWLSKKFFSSDGKYDQFVRILVNLGDQSMEEYLKEDIGSGDKFTFLSQNQPSSDYHIDFRVARRILKKFGFQKITDIYERYERVQTVEEWADSRLLKIFSDDKIIQALQDPNNRHVWVTKSLIFNP